MQLNLNPGGFEVVAKTRLFYAPETWAPPVISDGRLWVTQNELGPKLHCYDLTEAAPERMGAGPLPDALR
jgi:hypothetical protein